jgi:hypothetical protein
VTLQVLCFWLALFFTLAFDFLDLAVLVRLGGNYRLPPGLTLGGLRVVRLV